VEPVMGVADDLVVRLPRLGGRLKPALSGM
jgi:hypothetical protein